MLGVAHYVLAQRDAVETVHLAAVDRVETGRERVAEVVRQDRRGLGEGHGRTVLERTGAAVLDRAALGRALVPRVLPEIVVEGPVLLDQEDHMLDRVLSVRPSG